MARRPSTGDNSDSVDKASLREAYSRVNLQYGFHISLDDFIDNFKRDFRNLEHRTQSRSNFEVDDEENFDTRPYYIEWTGQDDLKKGYRVIEYWPDKSNEGQSFILWGNNCQLIDKIWQIHNLLSEGGISDEMTGGGMAKRKGQPQIVLYFQEDITDVDSEFRPVEGRISFRVMDKSDLPESPLPRITEADLRQYAKVIKQEFFGTTQATKYVWKKGKESINYVFWEEGYQLQLFCRNTSSGLDLIEKILKIQGHRLDRSRVTRSINLEEATAYPTLPPKINILGKEIREPRRRPIADVRFQFAKIFLYSLASPIVLVNRYGALFTSYGGEDAT